MVGTLFLFVYWPSFNSVLATGGVEQQRVIVNTILALGASALTSCFLATIMLGKFDMEVMLHATLAGGVAIASSCNMLTYAIYPLCIGAIAGLISALGYLKINPWCKSKFNWHDTCGVQWLHGLPGLLGGIFSALACMYIYESFQKNDYAVQ